MKYLRLSLPIFLLFSVQTHTDADFTVAQKARIAQMAAGKIASSLADEAKKDAQAFGEGLQNGAHAVVEKTKEVAHSVQQGAHHAKDAITGAVGESAVEIALERAEAQTAKAEEYQARAEQLQDQEKRMEKEVARLHDQLMQIKAEITATQQALNRLATTVG